MAPVKSFLLLAFGTLVSSDELIEQLGMVAAGFLEENMGALLDALPASIGDCSSGAPTPCIGDSSLFSQHKPFLYKAEAHWIGGLNTLSITGYEFARNVGSAGINFRVDGKFDELPLSLYIGHCLFFDRCKKLWDNTDACCGTEKKFSVNISMACAEDFTIDSFQLNSLDLDPFEIKEAIFGFDVKLMDITNQVKKEIEPMITKYLGTEPIKDGKSLAEFANADELIGGVAQYICMSTSSGSDSLVV